MKSTSLLDESDSNGRDSLPGEPPIVCVSVETQTDENLGLEAKGSLAPQEQECYSCMCQRQINEELYAQK